MTLSKAILAALIFFGATFAMAQGSDTRTLHGRVEFPDSTLQTTAGLTDLTGDVTTSGAGSVAATVAFVGGSAASAVNTAVSTVTAATSANTASTLVKRDSSGNFNGGTIKAFTAFKFPDDTLQTTAATATSPGGATGAVQFNASGAFTGDAGNLFWNNTTKRLGIGTATPSNPLEVVGQVEAASFDIAGNTISKGGSGEFIIDSFNEVVVNEGGFSPAAKITYSSDGSGHYSATLQLFRGSGALPVPPASGGELQISPYAIVGIVPDDTPDNGSVTVIGGTADFGNRDGAPVYVRGGGGHGSGAIGPVILQGSGGGKVGIGTTTPGAPLEVKDSGTGNLVRIEPNAAGIATIRLATAGGTDAVISAPTEYGAQALHDSVNFSAAGVIEAETAGLVSGPLSFSNAPLGTLTLYNPSGATYSYLANNGGGNGVVYGLPSGSPDFVVRTNAFDFSSGTERFRVKDGGNVGIGTASPGVLLDVAGSGTGSLVTARLQNTVAAANDSAAQIQFAANRDTSGLTDVAGISGAITDITDADYTGALIFKTANNGAPVERARIDNNGRLGIGTTGPLAAIDLGNSPAAIRLGVSGQIYGNVLNGDYIDPFNAVWGTPGGGWQLTDTTAGPGAGASMVMPTAGGAASSVLQNDGAGNTSWVKPTRSSSTSASSATCSVTCGAGVLTGGGCQNSVALNMADSYPSSATTWSCVYTLATGACTAWAICQ